MWTSDGLDWRATTRCYSGTCVEVAIRADQVFLRHSAEPDGPWLILSRPSWAAFLEGVRAGHFDRPGTG